MSRIPNLREVKRCIVIDVREGAGIDGDPARVVHYVYDEQLKLIGSIDTWLNEGNTTIVDGERVKYGMPRKD